MDYWRLTFDLYIDVEKLWVVGGWWVVYLDYNVSSGPFLSYEIEIGDGPGPELDNSQKALGLKCLKLINSFIIYHLSLCNDNVLFFN